MADFPTTAAQLTAAHLNTYLIESGHLQDAQVTDVAHQLIGTGKMGDNARLTLTYAGDAQAAPSTLIAKFPADDEHARAMAGAQGAYYNEVMFYRELAPRTNMRTPTIFGSELSEDRTEFLLLMEDMSPAEPGSQFIGESREHTELALAQAAKLAATFYGEDFSDCDHVLTPASDDGGAFGASLMEQSWPGFVDRFGHGMSAEMIAFGERNVHNHSHFVTRFTGPKTLAHGDFRTENILFDGNQSATTVDWQTPGASSVLTDAAYFLGGSVETEDRRAWEKDLIEGYRAELDRQGVSLSFQDCWDQYREFAQHGILLTVLGASFSSADERGDRMFMTMIQRHLQHCLDVDAAEFLPA